MTATNASAKTVFIVQAAESCVVSAQECGEFLNFFLAHGYGVASSARNASVILIGSCTISRYYDKTSFELITQMNREKPKNSLVIATGCAAKVYKKKLESEYHCLVLDLQEKDLLYDHLDGLKTPSSPDDLSSEIDGSVYNKSFRMWKKQWQVLDFIHQVPGAVIPWIRKYTGPLRNAFYEYSPRSYFLKISSGCANACSFCSIKKARGHIQSRDPEILLEEIRAALKKGYDHFLFVCDDFTSYGLDKGLNFVDLFQRVLDLDEKFTVTLRSFNPDHCLPHLERFLKTIRPGRIRGIELELQSGSDKLLKAMNRRGTQSDFLKIATGLKEKDPAIAFKTHIIVGFPGESEEDFEETLKIVRTVPFVRIDINAYDEKPGTPSFSLPNKVPRTLVHDRIRKLQRLRYRYYFFE